ncbi:hypothetical protein FQZ97_773910 [compost metagenome]
MASRCWPTRQATSQTQAAEASRARPNSSPENSGTKPGASRATLAAGLAGTPVCMANQITQMMRAQPVKKISVNQSISADMLRRSVGSANAASAASAGRASSSVRSCRSDRALAAKPISAAHSGRATWGRKSWRRQRHSVQSTRGQAGQVNHSSRRPQLGQFNGSGRVGTPGMGTCPASTDTASTIVSSATDHHHGLAHTGAASSTEPPSDSGLACVRRATKTITRRPPPSRTVVQGAPLNTRPSVASPHTSTARQGWRDVPCARLAAA